MKVQLFKAAILAASALASVSFASAAVILDPHPFSNPDPAPQIHNTGNQSGTTVTGVTVGGGHLYTFTSPSTLTLNGAGHATVAGPWHTLTMAPSNPLHSFSAVDFNLQVSGLNGRSAPFFANVSLNLVGGGSVSFNNLALGNGGNKYLVFGNAGEQFSSISFTGWRDMANTIVGNFDDVRQIDVMTVLPAGVPEPATWAMMIAGFGLTGAAMRRKPKQAALA